MSRRTAELRTRDMEMATSRTAHDSFSSDLTIEAASSCDSIALFSAYYPAQGGGIELVCGDLVNGLCQLGKSINWLALEGDTAGVHVDCAITPLPGTNAIYSRSGIPFPLPKPISMPRIWTAIRESSVVIIAEANFVVNCAAFIVAKLQKKPVLLIEHVGAPSTVSAWIAAMMRLAERFAVRPMLRSADALVYISPAVAKHFSSLAARREAQIIGHGIDTELFTPALSEVEKSRARAQLGLAGGPPLACFAGRCTTSKGIEVFMRVAELRPDWNFVVAGIGPIDPTSCGLSNLTALGHVDRSTLSTVYKASDALILPSRSESFSLVVREALAAGIRVLCSDQIIETDPALKPFLQMQPVNLDAREATARLFAAALDDPAPSSGANARAYVVENCSWTRIIERYAALIDDLRCGAKD